MDGILVQCSDMVRRLLHVLVRALIHTGNDGVVRRRHMWMRS